MIGTILSSLERVRCAPLSANISRRQCAVNRRMAELDPWGPCYSCRTCAEVQGPEVTLPQTHHELTPRTSAGFVRNNRQQRSKAKSPGRPRKPPLTPPQAPASPPQPQEAPIRLPESPVAARSGEGQGVDTPPGKNKRPYPAISLTKLIRETRDAMVRAGKMQRFIDTFLADVYDTSKSRAVRRHLCRWWAERGTKS